MISRKISRKSSFGVPIGLIHLVSENIGLGGHFGVFTTHTTHLDHLNEASELFENDENPGGISPNVHDVK